MKKMFLMTIMGLFLFASCQKAIERSEDVSQKLENVAIPILTDEKEGAYYEVKVKVGHSGEKCPGCIMRNGKLVHVDCQGCGNYCNPTATVKVIGDGKGLVYQAITLNAYDLTDVDTFLLPNRSLFIMDANNGTQLWLNIPEQTLIRDFIQGNFVIKNLTYDEEPLFSNE